MAMSLLAIWLKPRSSLKPKASNHNMPSIGTTCDLEYLKDNGLKSAYKSINDDKLNSPLKVKEEPCWIHENVKYTLQSRKRNHFLQKVIRSVLYVDNQGHGNTGSRNLSNTYTPVSVVSSLHGTHEPTEFNIKEHVNERIKSWQAEIEQMTTAQSLVKDTKTKSRAISMKRLQALAKTRQALELDVLTRTSAINPQSLTLKVTTEDSMRNNEGRSVKFTSSDKNLNSPTKGETKLQNKYFKDNALLKLNASRRPMRLLKLVDIDIADEDLSCEDANAIYKKAMRCVSKETAYQLVHGGKPSSKDDFEMLEKSFKDVHGELDYNKLISDVHDGWKLMKLDDTASDSSEHNYSTDDVPSLIDESSHKM